MNENKLAYLSLNMNKPEGCIRLTNKQNTAIREVLEKNSLDYIDLYNCKTVSEINLQGLRNSAAIRQKILDLLDKRGEIAFKLDKWKQSGINIITQLDKEYPARLVANLKNDSPALIFALGNTDLLNHSSIAIAGSREIDKAIEKETVNIVNNVIKNEYAIVSGGAVGVDLIAMQTALENGSKAIGFIKQNFNFRNLSRSGWNKYLQDGSLLLLSEIPPDEKLTRHKIISAAMNRNKYIYALADYGIIVASDSSGGTWQGACEQIKKYNRNVFVVNKEFHNKPGNAKLIKEFNALELPDIDENFVDNLASKYENWENSYREKSAKSSQLEISFE